MTVSFLICLFADPARVNAQTPAYVANSNANVVTVIDTATNTVIDTIPVGSAPAHVAISKDGTRAYVTNSGSSSVSVIDTVNRSVVGTVAVADQPSTVAVTPAGDVIYVLGAAGVVQAIDTKTQAIVAAVPVGGPGSIAITPDGTRAYVAAGTITVIDTATHGVLTSFVPEVAATEDIFNFAVALAISPDGAHAYAAVNTFYYDWQGFRAGGGIAVIDTATNVVTDRIELFSLPNSVAFTPDGSRAYAGIQSYWADTLYGAGFLPGRTVIEIDTAANAMVGYVDLGGDGSGWWLQNTAADLVVTPDRSAVLVSIPRINSIAAIDTASNQVTQVVAVADGPVGLAIVPDSSAEKNPFTIEAVNDNAPAALPAVAGRAISNVLANDRIGHAPAAVGNVTLSFVSSTHPGVTLDAASGAVWIADGIDVGGHSLTYRICEPGNADNCADAVVTLTVRAPFVIDAADDNATSYAGVTAVANVAANDTLDAGPAGSANVSLSVVAADAGVSLDPASGSVNVADGAPAGVRALVYRICEIASPANCDEGTVIVTVVPRAIRADNDQASAPRTGGRAIASVLGNDTLGGEPATAARVTIALLSSTGTGLTLDTTSGAVFVAAGASAGVQALDYRICERASPDNCSDGTATVSVNEYAVNAVNDQARASSKNAGRAISNVLANDTLGGVRATTSNVRISLVSPASTSSIRLNTSDGSVDVLGKTSGGSYTLVYQICEIASPANCGRATITIDLSGKN